MIKTIKLKGKEGYKVHPIRLSTAALGIFEEITGLDGLIALQKGDIVKSLKSQQALIYGGIKMGYSWNEEECPLTYEQVGNQMDVRGSAIYIKAAIDSLIVDDELDLLEKKSLRKVS